MVVNNNKIILISNRGVREKRSGATLFKNKLTKSSHRLRCAEINQSGTHKKYQLTLVDKGDEQNYLSNAVETGNDNPWVFFVHGNNQTLDKNLKKCFKIKDLYDVNVVAFSWPSVHHGKIRGKLNYVPFQLNFGKYLTRQLVSKIKQYRKAKNNAELSAPDLIDSLTMAKNSFSNSSSKVSFVCHSLGHYVLQKANDHQSLGDVMFWFNNVLLHQGDADNKNHEHWVDAIGKGESVVVTTNEKDKILEVSNIYNHKSMKNKRLGNVSKDGGSSSPVYKDFTGTKNIGLTGHTIFLTSRDKNEDVFNFFKSIIS